jgi:hypothetical protein
MNRKWTDEMQIKAEAMAACGCGLMEIGQVIGVNYKTVKRYLIPGETEKNRYRVREWAKFNQEKAIWRGMLRRCYSPRSGAYSKYGAKGITVCNQWKESFDIFFQDVGPRPTCDHFLSRIDCAGNYEPNNICWSTRKEQSSNRRNNVWVELGGQLMILSDAARQLGENPSRAAYHVHRGTHPFIKLEAYQ